jgi:hypothetical protein
MLQFISALKFINTLPGLVLGHLELLLALLKYLPSHNVLLQVLVVAVPI